MTLHPESEDLSAYLDGELPEREQVSLEAHLAGCAQCSATLSALRATLTDLGVLGEPALDEQTRWAVRAAVARERKRGGAMRRRAWTAGTAAASIATILAFVLVTQGGNDAQDAAGGGTAVVALDAADAGPRTIETNFDEAALGEFLSSYDPAQDGFAFTAPVQAPAAGGGPSGAPESSSAPGEMRAYAQADAASSQRCLAALRRVPPAVRVLDSVATWFKNEPVYLYLFEAPAEKPTRLELWVTTRESCEVRYFRQAKRPPEQ